MVWHGVLTAGWNILVVWQGVLTAGWNALIW